MKVHALKTETPFWEAVAAEEKTFEVRKNDRDFKVGDYLVLLDFNPTTGVTAARKIVRRVSYVLTHEQFPGVVAGFVVLALALTSYKEDVEVFREYRSAHPDRPKHND